MTLCQIINLISEEAKNKFRPDLKKYGKNFRAISDSALLEVLNPLFKKYDVAYEVIIQEQKLHIEHLKAGRDSAGNLIEKLLFVAEAKVIVVFWNWGNCDEEGNPERMCEQGWGCGVDFGDKATGKAITAATKYALFKGLRLQYSDDPDAEESTEIESIIEEESKEVSKKEAISKKSNSKSQETILASEGQLNYIKGLCVAGAISDEDFKKEFGFYPYDPKMPMPKAREIIDILKKRNDEKLPF